MVIMRSYVQSRISLQREVLVFKLCSIYRLSSSAIMVGEVSALEHEVCVEATRLVQHLRKFSIKDLTWDHSTSSQ